MKFLIVLCVLALVALSSGKPQTRSKRCIYVEGQCTEECEEGTSSYTTGCDPVTPEATCDEPNPVPGEGAVCDYSACYCNAPTVRNTESGKCVKLEYCPPKKDKKEQKDKKE